jgi:ferric-dicitrate binding protein FerR (iron transport regulator)
MRDDEQSIANILRIAGERPEIPLSVESRVYSRVQQEWRSSTAVPNSDRVYGEVRKSWRRGTLSSQLFRWLAPAGVVATAILAFVLLSTPQPEPAQVVATVSRVVGSGLASQQFSAGSSVKVGDLIATGNDEGLSLRLARNESLRIDANTEVRIDASDRFTLLAGRIYADTGQFVYRDKGLLIGTEFGTVSDVGTQFSVSVSTRSLDVAVREGRVDVTNTQQSYAARMGERLTLDQAGSADLVQLDPHDPSWAWVTELTPSLDLTGKSLLDFLKWGARETGRVLQFESDDTRMFAMRTDVHGSVEGLTPDEALDAILATTSVRYRIEADKIVISR